MTMLYKETLMAANTEKSKFQTLNYVFQPFNTTPF